MDISFPMVTLSEGLAKVGGGDPISLFGVFGCMLSECVEMLPCVNVLACELVH